MQLPSDTLIPLASGLGGAILGARVTARNEMTRWRYDRAADAVNRFLRLAGEVQLAVREIAKAQGGGGHAAAVDTLDEALLRLNLEVRVLEMSTPWLLSGSCWRSVGDIENSVAFLRNPDAVSEWIAQYPYANAGLPHVDAWIQGCVNDARRQLFGIDWESNDRFPWWRRISPLGRYERRWLEAARDTGAA